MISNQLALIKREIWEHRSFGVTPLAVASVMVIGTLSFMVIGSGFRDVIDMALVGASNVGEVERRAMLTGLLSVYTVVVAISMGIVTVFYCLDCLYAERKDRSILFWRSLPVTDTETVVSKLLVAMLVIPAATYVAILATHILVLLMASVWVEMQGGSAAHLLWNGAALLDTWAATSVIVFAVPLWLAPFIGWFLFVSGAVKRSPLLMAFLPLAVVPLIELTFESTLLAKAIWLRPFQIPLFSTDGVEAVIDRAEGRGGIELREDMVSLVATLDVTKFVSSPSLWLGLVVCGLLAAAAVYVRRYRDES